MIKIKFESGGHPDYSRIVGAEMDKEYTVIGFIDEILKMYPKDYGSISIDDEIFLKYKDGVLDWSFINLRLSGLVVEKVEGMSSYYHTDYKLVSKKEADKQEKKSPSAELMDLVLEMGVEMSEKGLEFSPIAKEEIGAMRKNIDEMFEYAETAFKELDTSVLPKVLKLEEIVDEQKKSLSTSHYNRLAEGHCSVELSPYFTSTVSGLERVADHLVNVGYSIVNPTGDEEAK